MLLLTYTWLFFAQEHGRPQQGEDGADVHGATVVGGLSGLGLGNRWASRLDRALLQRVVVFYLAVGIASIVRPFSS